MKFNEDVWNDGKFSIVHDDMGYNMELFNCFRYNCKYQIEYIFRIIKVNS